MPNESLVITSPAFVHGQSIPVRHTGYGEDVSPPLSVAGIPPQAKSLAVIMVDLDVPMMREYPHWVLWNLPAQADIPGSIPPGARLDALGGAQQGKAYGKHTYRGPKPPKFLRAPHRYVFTVYALDRVLAIGSDADKKALLQAMQGHILAQGSLLGLYQNGR